MFTFNLRDVKSAIITGILTSIIVMAGYALEVGDIFKIDLKVLANVGFFSLLTTLVSLLKAILTSNSGKFIGVTKIK